MKGNMESRMTSSFWPELENCVFQLLVCVCMCVCFVP